MNKKGLIMDFGELVIAGLVMLALVFILVIVIQLDGDAKQDKYIQEIAMIDSSINTRIILMHELKPDYKVYEMIIDAVNNDKPDMLDMYIPQAIDAFYPDKKESWYYYVSMEDSGNSWSHDGVYNGNKKPFALSNYPSKILIPNPENEDINVLIKRILPTDFELEEVARQFNAETGTFAGNQKV